MLTLLLRTGILVLLFSVGTVEAATMVASRTQCTAPCLVFFENSDNITTASEVFLENRSVWNFGDTGAGTWGTSGLSKNSEYRATAAHVYETPGVSPATLNEYNGSGVFVGSDSETITVIDPDVTYAGTLTTCISSVSEADFTGCPSGATQITTNDLSGIGTYMGSGERLLFDRGSSWTSNTNNNVSTTGTRIGAYGTCVNPDANTGVCENAPHITATASSVTHFNLTRPRDFVLQDIKFTGTTDTNVISGQIDFENLLALRLEIIDGFAGASWYYWRSVDSDYHDVVGVVSCKISGAYGNAIFVAGERITLLGNDCRDSRISHLIRVTHGYKGLVAHNISSGTSLETETGRQAFKYHGPKEDMVGTFAETGGGGLRNRSQFMVVSNNLYGSSGPWPIGIQPQNAASDERVSWVVVENNHLITHWGNQSYSDPDRGFGISARNVVVRNNVVDASGADDLAAGVYIWRWGIEPLPDNVKVYNNTVYSNSSDTKTKIGVLVIAGSTNVTVRNNLVSFPNSSNGTAVSGPMTASNNLLTDTPGFVDPENVDPLARDFSIVQSSPAVNQGFSVPVTHDFSGDLRTGIIDLGAFEYDGTAPTCDSQNLHLCLTEGDCTTAGGYWYDSVCNVDPQGDVCDPQHLNLCDQGNCSSSGGGYWWDNTCNVGPEPPATTDRTVLTSGSGHTMSPGSRTILDGSN